MAVQHHLDQPLMHVKELDISPGFETQIAVSPVLFSTTNEALRRFEPEQRGCYSGSGGYEVSSTVIQNLKAFFKARIFTRVSIQGVKSLGGHFACLCQRFEFYEVKKNFVVIFQKENGYTFTLFIIFIVKSLQKEQNSTNLLL